MMGLLSSHQGLGLLSLSPLLLQQFLLDAAPQLSLGRVSTGSRVQLFFHFIFTHQVSDDGVKHFLVSPAAKDLWGAVPIRSGGAGMGHLGGPGTSSPSSSHCPHPSPLPLCHFHWVVALPFARKKLTLQACSHGMGRLTFSWGCSFRSTTVGIGFSGALQKVHFAESLVQVISPEDKRNSASASLIF